MTKEIENAIINTFFSDIVPNASKTGVIEIDGTLYNIKFNTRIEDKEIINDDSAPLLNISNLGEFNKYLIEYINEKSKFFDDLTFKTAIEIVCSKDKSCYIKYLLAVLFINAREDDFKNPVKYLKLITNFIKGNYLVEKYNEYIKVSEINNMDIEVYSHINSPSLETPYVFKSRIVDIEDEKINYYTLPSISYGIDNDTVYIYSIQGIRKTTTSSSDKKINRMLYKINRNVKDSDEYKEYKYLDSLGIDSYYPENITDVTHNSVLSLTIFLGIIKKEGFTNIIVVDYLPLRYKSKSEGIKKSISLLKGIYSDSDINNRYNDQIYMQEKTQDNITNKFIRTFNRVNYHLENMNIISFPGEIDNSMHIKLNDKVKEDDNIINLVYNKLLEEQKRK